MLPFRAEKCGAVMERRKLFGAVLTVVALALCGRAEAASVYSARSSVNLSLSTSSIDGLNGLLFRGSDVSYAASAVAKSDGTAVVDSARLSVTKNGGSFTFGSYFDRGGKLGDLLFVPSTGPLVFNRVFAQIDGAEAEGGNSLSSPGNTASIAASVNGKASDPVEFASSSVSFDVFIAFQNVSTSQAIVSWSLAYLLSSSASADPRGTADAIANVQLLGGGVCGGALCPDTAVFTAGNAACDPATSDCAFGPSPPSVNQTRVFQYTLAPNETRFISFEVLARGSATVVPLPAAGWFLLTCLAGLGALRCSRRAAV